MPKDIQKNINDFYGTLMTELDRFPNGEQFHSIRDLIRRHHVSRRVVEKTLERLEANGQIRIEPAAGIYVSRNRDKTPIRLPVFTATGPRSTGRTLIQQSKRNFIGVRDSVLHGHSSNPTPVRII